MRDWIIIGILYIVGVGFFRFLGGFGSAAEALRRWGESSSAARGRSTSSS